MTLDIRIELARLAYGEQILRCTNRGPDEVQGLLTLDGEEEKALKWMAFAVAKREGNADHIRGLLAYLVSHHLGRSDRKKRKSLVAEIDKGTIKLKDLTFEQLSGTQLRWEQIFKLVGHEFNPTRERELIKQIYDRLAREAEISQGGKP
jgi:hypothetical protein